MSKIDTTYLNNSINKKAQITRQIISILTSPYMNHQAPCSCFGQHVEFSTKLEFFLMFLSVCIFLFI